MLYLDTFVHWLHLAASMVWLGGMAFVAVVLNPVLRSELAPSVRLPLVKVVGLRFKWVEWACLAILLASGLYKLGRMGWWSPFSIEGYGPVLILKLLFVGAMVVLSFLHTFVWGPRLGEPSPSSEAASALGQRVVFWARVNLVLGFAVVLCGALLRMNPF